MKLEEAISETLDIIDEVLPAELIAHAMFSVQHNDEAHNLKHVVGVIKYGNELCYHPKINLAGKPEHAMVLAGCLMHDLGCFADRDTHHIISYGMAFDYIRKYANNMFSPEQIKIIAESCLQHRGSYKEERTHFVCDVVALADRGRFDIDEYITRSIQFHNSRFPGEYEHVFEEVSKHIPEKFRKGGYVWEKYPKVGFEILDNEINSFIAVVENTPILNQRIESIMAKLNIN